MLQKIILLVGLICFFLVFTPLSYAQHTIDDSFFLQIEQLIDDHHYDSALQLLEDKEKIY